MKSAIKSVIQQILELKLSYFSLVVLLHVSQEVIWAHSTQKTAENSYI